MFPYYALICWVIMIGVIVKPRVGGRRLLFCLMAYGAIGLMMALRASTVGVDTAVYCRTYHSLAAIPWSDVFNNARWEAGYISLVKLCSLVSSDPQFIVVVSSAIISFGFGFFAYAVPKRPLEFTVLFILSTSLFTQMNLMRQAIAISFILMAFVALYRKRIACAVLLTFVASLFHSTAIACLAIIPLTSFSLDKRWAVVYFVTLVSVFLSRNFLLDVMMRLGMSSYAESEIYGGENYLGSLLNFLFYGTLIATGYISRTLSVDTIAVAPAASSRYSNALSHACVICLIACLASTQVNILARFVHYFAPLVLTYYLDSIDLVQRSRQRFLLFYAGFGVVLVYFAVVTTLRPEWFGVDPYRLFFV